MAGETFPSVSVIVVGYQSRRFLDACLGSLVSQEYPGEYEILFVDNASDDDSVAYVRSQFLTVRVAESGENLGYAGGNNLGAHLAQGEVLAFINPDTRASADWLAELIRPLVLDPTVGLTTAKIVLLDQPERINTCGNDLSLAGIATCRRAGEVAALVAADEEITAVSGAACAIRAELFHRLGGFDAHFWMYLEDTDLSWRARLAGYRCVLAARSVVAHRYVFSLPSSKTQVIERNRYRMLAKNLGGWMLLALLPCLLLGELVTWGWALLRGPRHLWAKTLALLWVLTHLLELWRAHRTTQALRCVPDGAILRQHTAALPIATVADGVVSRLAGAVLVPLGILTAMLALGLIDATQRVGPAGESHARLNVRIALSEDQKR